MFTQVSIQLLVPTTVFYLIITQCKLVSTGVEDSSFIKWTNVDMKNDTWPGIKNLIGKDPCAENMKYCMELATIVKAREKADALRKDCELDAAVKYPNGTSRQVCWIRQKSASFSFQGKKTTYEAQFWTESPNVTRIRHCSPPVRV
uniref:Uncharacterized protein n=1 Tax=Cacopsylla melanoneura TaxID=428564 RepID=A0A8D8W3J0_9HEMI